MPFDDQTATFAIIGPLLERAKIQLWQELLNSPRAVFKGRITPTVLARSRMRSRSAVGRLGPSAQARLEALREARRIGLVSDVDMEEMWMRDP